MPTTAETSTRQNRQEMGEQPYSRRCRCGCGKIYQPKRHWQEFAPDCESHKRVNLWVEECRYFLGADWEAKLTAYRASRRARSAT